MDSGFAAARRPGMITKNALYADNKSDFPQWRVAPVGIMVPAR
jgi:hypothetical protein